VVSKTLRSYRDAFTMIELIFAIVIIAITVLSLPMMTQINQRGVESNIVQEAIFAASTELMGATAGYWDENSLQDINMSHLERVINISGDCNTSTQLRPGHINQMYHRRCLDSNSTTAHNSNVAIADINVSDLNDAAHGAQNIFTDTTLDDTGYKGEYQSVVAVGVSPSDGNIKDITVTVSDENGAPVTILKTQSANVGEIDYFKRTF